MGFHRRVTDAMNASGSGIEAQIVVLREIMNEIHTVKWILWWVLVILPASGFAVGAFLTALILSQRTTL